MQKALGAAPAAAGVEDKKYEDFKSLMKNLEIIVLV
jgi:hypothetical protein